LFAGLTAGVSFGIGHGAAGGVSPFGGAKWLVHGIAQGAISELRGGSLSMALFRLLQDKSQVW